MDMSPAAALAAPLPALTDTPLALLVDGENIPKTCAPDLLPVARVCGDARIRRVYGGLQHISGWEDHGFRLCPTRPGKNSADMLLCVEAMLLALREGFATIAIVTGDRDFSYLAEQLREIGIRVIGIGDRRTPASFRNACSCFYQLDEAKANKTAGVAEPAQAKAAQGQPTLQNAGTIHIFDEVLRLVAAAGAGGMQINAINAPMHRQGVKISERSEKTWRNWFEKRTSHFVIDPEGPEARVRLRHTLAQGSK